METRTKKHNLHYTLSECLHLRGFIAAAVALVWLHTPAVQAQANNAPPAGPVDIQANEQEFSGDQVLAKGNVKVIYKDTVITGPEATLSRNATGSPQSALFTGHPHLVQNDAVMDSDTMQFDIVNHGIVAQGHAHSEVVSGESSSGSAKPPATKTASGAAPAGSTAVGAGQTTTAGADTAPATSSNATTTTAGANPNTASQSAASQNTANQGVPEKIITDSDLQEYDQESEKFIATGNVHVKHADIKVTSDRLQLVYGTDKKPETAIFTGRAVANQGKNITRADVVTYNLATRRLQATGHVRSKVIQEKADAAHHPATQQTAYSAGAAAAAQTTTNTDTPASPTSNSDKLKGGVSDNEEEIYILSDSQDYNKQTGRICADGNVKIYYEDSVGSGPRAILVRGESGKAEEIVFIGRSQVNQPHKWWIGDQIVLIVANKHVLAQGNTRAYVERQPVCELKKNKEEKNNSDQKGSTNTQLASRSRASQELSAARIEATR